MLITEHQQATWVSNYVKQRHTSDECIGFIDGIEKALTEVAKGCIDKQVAINFCQHLLKDYSTQEVTQETLNKFLNKK